MAEQRRRHRVTGDRYAVSRPLACRAVFADALSLNDVFSLSRTVGARMRVIREPERHSNLVGERSYIVLRVSLLGSAAVGEMIFSPSNMVYIDTAATQTDRD